jgi:hypothetical protein
MSTELDLQTILSTFIKDEDAALKSGHQGPFWPMNHYRIRNAILKADQLLESTDRQKLYFHYLRLSGQVPVVSNNELPHHVEGYRRLLPLLDTSQADLARRHNLLFVFGFDEKGALPDGTIGNAKQLKDYLKLTAQCAKYTNLSAQRAKLQNFGAHTHHAERLYQTLRHLGYCHDRRYGPDIYSVTDLSFWGMVLVILLHEGRRVDLLHDFLEGGYSIPQKDKHFAILHATAEAVLSTHPAIDERFRKLAEQLAAIQRERRAATESMAFARALCLPLEADENWQIYISIPTADNKHSPYSDPNLTCEIQPDPDRQWHIRSRLGAGQLYSEQTGRILQNDMRIEGLGAGNLLSIPQWLTRTGKRLGIRFDVERAVVKCGRNRAAATRLMEWLAG